MTIYEAGHEVPYYQPKASLEMFRRVLNNFDIATGTERVTENYNTTGSPDETHTEPYVAIPSTSGVPGELSYTAEVTNPITSVLLQDYATITEDAAAASSSAAKPMEKGSTDHNLVRRVLEKIL